MAGQPPSRPRATAEATGPSVADPTTDRALTELRELLTRVKQSATAPLVKYLTLIRQRPTPTINESIFVSDLDGELYYRDSEGRDIRLTEDGFISGSDVDVGPLPANISAVTVNASGDLDVNDSGNVIQDLYVVNLHASGTSDTHGSRFVQMPAHLGGIVTGTPIYFTSGKGVGSGAGACAFYSNMPQLRRGSRILSVSVRLHRTVGAGTSQIVFKRVANSPVTLGTASSISAPGGDLDLTISGLTETVGAATSYTMEVTLPQSQDAFQTVTIEYDRP